MYESKQKQLRANGLKRVESGYLAQRKCVRACVRADVYKSKLAFFLGVSLKQKPP